MIKRTVVISQTAYQFNKLGHLTSLKFLALNQKRVRFNNRLTNFILVTQLFVYKKYKKNSLQM